MTLDDLAYIFKPQIDEGTEKLYFMLVDGEYKVVYRHPVTDIASLLPMLSCFEYHGAEARMPRFVK